MGRFPLSRSAENLKNEDPLEPRGLGFLLITIAELLGHFPGRKAISDLFLRHYSHLSLSGQLVSFSLTIFYMVLVFKIREGIVGYVVLDSISWQSSSGCFHLCIGTLSLLSPHADFLTLPEMAEGHRPFPFFFNCNEIHKVDRFTPFLFIRLSCCGPGEAPLLSGALTALRPTLRPPRVSLLAPF